MFALRWLMLIPALVPPTLASAQEDQAAGQYISRQEHEKLLRELEVKFLRELEVLKAQMKALAAQGAPAEKTVAPAVTTEGPKAPPAPKPEPAQPAIAETETGDREEEAREAQRQLDIFLRRQKLLFQAGEVQIDFGAAYAKESFGGVGTRSANASVTARYGVADDVEFDLAVPLRYVEDFDRSGVAANRRPSSVGLGDIEWAVRYAALREEGLLPDVVVALNAKSTTGDEDRDLGTGNWNVGTTVTLLKTIDPVVFFGSLGYTATLEDDGVNPGDEIPYSAGLGFSLNDRVSFSTTLNGLAVRRRSGSEERPEDPEDRSSGSADINVLQFATTVQLKPGLFIEPFVAFGLTEESPDFIVGISVPYQIPGRFPLPFVSERPSGK